MLRYIGATLMAGLLLAVALRSRDAAGAGEEPGKAPAEAAERIESPQLSATEVPGGRLVTVTQRLAGSVSRATLVYDLGGEEHTVDSTSCRRSLQRGPDASSAELEGDGYASEVKLSGKLPHGAKHLRLILEDETGTRSLPLDG
ncbi:MAG: hypothetical protein HC813_00065 [Planctomycetes bacterium]|nr:hypothetical protein [Planctomycetota bacterium]